MSDKDILIVTTRDILPHARGLSSLLADEGFRATVVVGEEGIPLDSPLPAAVVIWAPALVAYSLFKACRSYFPRKLTQLLIVLPSSEPPSFTVDPDCPNEAYLQGLLSTEEILLRLKQQLERPICPTPTPPQPARPATPPRRGRVITVFSAKGGVGKTAISTNLAVAIKETRQNDVLLIDGDLQFGDVAVWLGLTPKVGIIELLTRGAEIDDMAITSAVQEHESGLHVLLPPSHPATAERVRPEAIKNLVNLLRQMYDYIVIDTHTSYGEQTLAMLDVADDLILVVMPEISVIRNTQIFLQLCQILGYSDKLIVVLNRANTGIQHNHLPDEIRRLVKGEIVSDGRAVVWSLNTGKPFVQADRTLAVSKALTALAVLLAGPQATVPKSSKQRTFWLFGARSCKA